MEFKPSNNDVIDALKLRIMTDDDYVLDCLSEVGLNTSMLSRHAIEMILEDFRRKIEVRLKSDNHDATDTFKPFVNSKGNYQSDNSFEKFTLVPNENGTFTIYTETPSSSSYLVRKKTFSSMGIEMRRETILEGNQVSDVFTREDRVFIKCQRISNIDGSIIDESTTFVNPLINSRKNARIG